MCASGNLGKRQPEEFFPTIASMKNYEKEHMPTAVPRRGSFAHKLLMGARGGAQLPFLEKL